MTQIDANFRNRERTTITTPLEMTTTTTTTTKCATTVFNLYVASFQSTVCNDDLVDDKLDVLRTMIASATTVTFSLPNHETANQELETSRKNRGTLDLSQFVMPLDKRTNVIFHLFRVGVSVEYLRWACREIFHPGSDVLGEVELTTKRVSLNLYRALILDGHQTTESALQEIERIGDVGEEFVRWRKHRSVLDLQSECRKADPASPSSAQHRDSGTFIASSDHYEADADV